MNKHSSTKSSPFVESIAIIDDSNTYNRITACIINNRKVYVDTSSGYFLASDFFSSDDEYKKWSSDASTIALLNYLSDLHDIPCNKLAFYSDDIAAYQGYYVHEDLIIDIISRWSPSFRHDCIVSLKEHFGYKAESDEESLEESNDESFEESDDDDEITWLKKENEKLKAEEDKIRGMIDDLIDDNTEKSNKIDIMEIDINDLVSDNNEKSREIERMKAEIDALTASNPILSSATSTMSFDSDDDTPVKKRQIVEEESSSEELPPKPVKWTKEEPESDDDSIEEPVVSSKKSEAKKPKPAAKVSKRKPRSEDLILIKYAPGTSASRYHVITGTRKQTRESLDFYKRTYKNATLVKVWRKLQNSSALWDQYVYGNSNIIPHSHGDFFLKKDYDISRLIVGVNGLIQC